MSKPSTATAVSAVNGASGHGAGESPISEPASSRPAGRRLQRYLRYLPALPLILLLGIGCHACATHHALENEIENAQRNPETGVIVGTEEMALGPDDAGAACLLIHGFVGSRKDFADLGERLADAGFFVQMMRLPGHGTTPREFGALGPEDLLSAAREECRALLARFDRVYVVGFSMGGAITTIVAAEENERLAGAVLVSPYYKVTYYPYYILPPMTWNAMFSPVMPYVIKGDAFVRVNRREALPHIFSYRVVPTKGAKTLEALGRQARDPRTLEKITVPLLMVQAEGDEAASPKAGMNAFEAIRSPDKTHRMFSERSNHHLLWDYEAEEAKTVILEFLTRQEAAALPGMADSPAAQSSSAAQAP